MPALEERAEVLVNLRQYSRAMEDYDKLIAHNPKDFVSYNARAAAKLELGEPHDAIRDYDEAIRYEKRELQHSLNYQGRAEAYMRTRQWDLAIRDLTTAISLEIGGTVLLMNVNQFRALYPEYRTAANEAVARKLAATFHPDLKYEDFAKQFLAQPAVFPVVSSIVIPELYIKRSDAYIKAGNWHRASIEFRRAVEGFPNYAGIANRWREIDGKHDATTYIDLKIFDDTRRNSVKIWIKQDVDELNPVGTNDFSADGPYSLEQFELNCPSRQIRSVSFADYTTSGKLIGTRDSGKWGSVLPESFGEMLYNGACGVR
jgi:tetratricopeptide (TPR) repeat protein